MRRATDMTDTARVIQEMRASLGYALDQMYYAQQGLEVIVKRFRALVDDLDKRKPDQRRASPGRSVTARAGDVFRARVERGDPVAARILALLDQHGLRVADTGNRNSGEGLIRCLGLLEMLHVRDESIVERTLRVVVGAWSRDALSLRGDFISAVAAFLTELGDSVDEAHLIARLKPLSPREMLRATQGKRRVGLMTLITDAYTS